MPPAGEHADRALEIGSLELKLRRHFAALPVGLLAVSHQEVENGFARQERVMLAQVAQPQLGMAEDLAAVELFLTEQDLEQRALPRPVPSDEPHFDIIGNRGLGPVEQCLPAITLVGIPDLQQHGHLRNVLHGSLEKAGMIPYCRLRGAKRCVTA